MALTRTSFLEAVNRVLQMLGEAPVNSLQGQFGLAKQAEDSLNDVSRKIQSEGWSFNTDYEVTLQRNTSNEIPVGASVSRVVVSPTEYPDYDVIQRGAKLYDRRRQSYTFTEDLKADVTSLLVWDDLPEHAHQYIMIKAGRQLQEAILGSGDLTKINLTQELEARSQFLEEETTKSEHNMLRGNPNMTSALNTYLPSRALRRI
tara:strand:+ start:192 stop:800 length:609 start_codon:yes stop_codon:yes gene_type:complete